MKILKMMPVNFEMTLDECPPGFFLYGKHVGFKSEYKTEKGDLEVFNEAGEAWWGGFNTFEERDKALVIPIEPMWEDVEL